MSDPITRAEELAIKAGAIVDMIRAAGMGEETTPEAMSDAAWAAGEIIHQVVALLGEVPMARRPA